MHLPPPGPDPDFAARFGSGERISTPLLGADLRLSSDGLFSGFSSPIKGRQASLPCGGQHTHGALQDDVLRMLTFGRLSPLPIGAAGPDPRQATPGGLLGPLWNPPHPQTTPFHSAGRRSPTKGA